MLVIGWIMLNAIASSMHWDPYPFILLNLAFSTQAAYAAPLILLAQNRQDDRDRRQHRPRSARSRPAPRPTPSSWPGRWPSVRLALADVVSTEDLDDSLIRMAKLIADTRPEQDAPPGSLAPGPPSPDSPSPESLAAPESLASSESLTSPDSQPGPNHLKT